MNRAPFKLFCLDGHSHTPARDELIRDRRMQLVSGLSLYDLLVVIICYTFSFLITKSIRNMQLKVSKN